MTTTEAPTTEAPATPTPTPEMPLKARISLLHQRIVLTLRYAARLLFRLPIDELREQHRATLDRQLAETMQNMAAIMNQMNARLHWYEKRVPLIAKEYNAFLYHQKKLMERVQAQEDYAEREKRREEMAVIGAEPEAEPEPARPKLEVVSR